MKKKKIIIGSVFVLVLIGLYLFLRKYYKPELDGTLITCSGPLQKRIPCTNNSDCDPELMHNYCKPNSAVLLRCYNAQYFCGENAFCRGGTCN
jgi:hypothetical protein